MGWESKFSMKRVKKHDIIKKLMMKNYKLSTSTWDDKEINAIQKVIDTVFYSM